MTQYDYSFRVVADRRLTYTHPQVEQYQREKDIHLVEQADALLFEDAPCFSNAEIETLLKSDPDLNRRWQGFFGRRIHAVGAKNLDIPAYFPGHTIPAPGSQICCDGVQYRGSLLIDQYRHLLTFDGGKPLPGQIANFNAGSATKTRKIHSDHFWPWLYVRKPQLVFIEATESESNSDSMLEELHEQVSRLLNVQSAQVDAILGLMHRAWSTTVGPAYSPNTVKIVDSVLKQTSPDARSLDLLFELEAFAGYTTALQRLQPVASGIFGSSWIDVSMRSLELIRGTELCVNHRLFSELFNLADRGFAPIVINEFDNVSDGNHRLTASWIWNILSQCGDVSWDLEDLEFQYRIRDVVCSHFNMCQVSMHEALHHLGVFLKRDETRQRLIEVLRPRILAHGSLDEVPVVFLPEYFSSTVVKHSYDSGVAVVRVSPCVYEDMQSNPHAVLPPRSSYHFTDCAPLPWFTLVDSRERVSLGVRS